MTVEEVNMTTEEVCSDLDGVAHLLYAMAISMGDSVEKHALKILSDNITDSTEMLRNIHGKAVE